MQDLTLVGVHEDGEHLVLTDATGQRYRVRIDESLRAAVRRDRPRLAQLQVETEGLRPREIQARIRAGQSAEEIAETARIPLEHVRRFEGPVLAEREFVATQARGVRLRRPGSSMTPYTLGELVQQRLAQREVDDTEISWDAWREDDGTWVVCLSFHAGSTQRRAHWTYDTQLRHVAARDDEARWFTEEERPEATPGQRRLTPIRDGQRELPRGAVRDLSRDQGRDQVYDLEADEPRRGGDRYPEERHAPEPRYADARQDSRPDGRQADPRFGEGYPDEHFHPERYENVRYGDEHFHQDPYREEIYGEDRPAEVRRATVDLLDTLRERRGRRQHLTPADPGGPGPDAVDAAVETLRARAESLGEGSAARTTRHREGPDPEAVRLPADDVIELPDTEDEPTRRRPAPAGASGPGLAAPGVPSYTERAPERPATRTVSPSHPAAAGKRTVERQADRTGDRESGSRSGGSRSGAPRTGSVPAAGPGEIPAPAPRPAPRTAPVPKPPAASGRGPAARGTTGGPGGSGTAHPTGPIKTGPIKTGPVTGSIGRPSPAAPPAQPRDRDPGGTAPGQPEPPNPERPTPSRRNKRASVPSWDDIVFGSRRE